MKKIYKALAYEITEPRLFGIFHLTFASIIGFLTTIVCKKHTRCSERTERRISLYAWLMFVFLEAIKQFLEAFYINDLGELAFDYGWAHFPFQFCSAPLYVLPLIVFLPSGRLRESVAAFYSTYVLAAGLGVCIYPGTAFESTLFINVQTMLWHGTQVILGVFYTARRFYGKDKNNTGKYFLSGMPHFAVMLTAALILNEVVHAYLIATGNGSKFNMFYISPYYESIFPIVPTLIESFPYFVTVIAYILVFTLFAYLVYQIELFFIRRIEKRAERGTKSAKEE